MSGDARGDSGPRVLLIVRGSLGDLHPMLGVAIELRKRGVAIAMAANPCFQREIEACGAQFFPMGDAVQPHETLRRNIRDAGRLGVFRWMRRMGSAVSADVVASLRAAIPAFAPDLVVGHVACLGGPAVAEARGVEWWTVVLAPASILSDEDPNVYALGLDVTRAPRVVLRVRNGCIRRVARALVDPGVKRALGADGVGRRDHMFDEMVQRPTLALFSPVLRGPAADDPPGVRIVGFSRYRSRVEADAALEAFLEAGAPPVIIGLGSMFSIEMREINARVVEACRALGRRSVVIGEVPEGFALRPGEFRSGFVDASRVFARSAAVVHHSGIGTAAAAIAAGVPALALPFATDQFDTASRLRRLGLAVVGDPRSSVRTLTRVLGRVVEGAELRRRIPELAPTMFADDGAKRAAELIAARVGAAGDPGDGGASVGRYRVREGAGG